MAHTQQIGNVTLGPNAIAYVGIFGGEEPQNSRSSPSDPAKTRYPSKVDLADRSSELPAGLVFQGDERKVA